MDRAIISSLSMLDAMPQRFKDANVKENPFSGLLRRADETYKKSFKTTISFDSSHLPHKNIRRMHVLVDTK